MSRITTCPHCSTPFGVSDRITDKTLICPRCLAEVDNARLGSQIRADDINTNVKRDLNVGSIVLAVLIGLCVLGIAMTPFVPLGRDQYGMAHAAYLVYSFAVLGVLVSIAIIRGLVRWGISGVRTPSVGNVLGIMFLSLGTIIAVFIFIFFTCIFLLH